MTDTLVSTQYERRQLIGLFTGLTFFLLLLFVPPPSGMEVQAWRVTAAAVLIGTWWISEAIHPSVTALLPLVLFPLLHILTPRGRRDRTVPDGCSKRRLFQRHAA